MYGSHFRPSLCRIAIVVLVATLTPVSSGAQPAPVPALPLEAFAPSFLGMYKKVTRIEGEIARYAEKYGVDLSLAKAVCMYESGGNANLASAAGANGYFQVMPSTFRLMGVSTNIEAGIKYLGQLVRQLGREDYALAGYNGGPGRVAARRPMPLESLQYVIGVGSYRAVLKAYEPLVRLYAGKLSLSTVKEGEDWWDLSQRLSLPVTQLKLHNPFLAARPLRAGYLVAYPPAPRADVLAVIDGESRYRTRLGDNYLAIAFALNVDVDRLREANQLWRLQPLLQDSDLVIPLTAAASTEYLVQAGDTLTTIARARKVDRWDIVRDNNLWDETIHEGMTLRVRQGGIRPAAAAAPAPPVQLHRVRRGETLSGLARRYGTTVRAIQSANDLGKRTLVRVGDRLRIPPY